MLRGAEPSPHFYSPHHASEDAKSLLEYRMLSYDPASDVPGMTRSWCASSCDAFATHPSVPPACRPPCPRQSTATACSQTSPSQTSWGRACSLWTCIPPRPRGLDPTRAPRLTQFGPCTFGIGWPGCTPLASLRRFAWCAGVTPPRRQTGGELSCCGPASP